MKTSLGGPESLADSSASPTAEDSVIMAWALVNGYGVIGADGQVLASSNGTVRGTRIQAESPA